MEQLRGQSSRVGLPIESKSAGRCLFWSGRLGVGICAILKLRQQTVGFTSTRPFMILYIMQTLSDDLLDCSFSGWS